MRADKERTRLVELIRKLGYFHHSAPFATPCDKHHRLIEDLDVISLEDVCRYLKVDSIRSTEDHDENLPFISPNVVNLLLI